MLRDFIAWPGTMLEEVLGLPSVGVCPLPLTLCADKNGAPDATAYIPAIGTKFTTHMVGATACSAIKTALGVACEVRSLFSMRSQCNSSLTSLLMHLIAYKIYPGTSPCVQLCNHEGVLNVVLCSATPLQRHTPVCPAQNSAQH